MVETMQDKNPNREERTESTDESIPSVDVGDSEPRGDSLILPADEREEIRKRFAEARARHAEILNDPAVIERGNLRRNWQDHKEVEARYYDLQCPACEADADSLRWVCCDLRVPDASKLAVEQYQRSIDDSPNDTWRKSAGVDEDDTDADAEEAGR